MDNKKAEKLLHNFESGLISDSEAANSWVLGAIDAQSVEECMTRFKSLPKAIQIAICRLVDQIRLNAFKWSPFLIATCGDEQPITFDSKQRTLCEAILLECKIEPQDMT
jgi:hypothetical protein